MRLLTALTILASGLTATASHDQADPPTLTPSRPRNSQQAASRTAHRTSLPAVHARSVPGGKASPHRPPVRRALHDLHGGQRQHLDWPALARCESGGNPRAVSMGRYFGLYQADQSTWDSVWQRLGRHDLVGVRPDTTSPATQLAFAQALYDDRGASPWPTCGWRLAS